jgi:chemosensory pili system protein ChpA (sensor histidine kinase/response regulator)
MSTSAELDIGPLTWVKGEIDLALERAVEALDRHSVEGGDSPHLKSARTHLHQAHGALSIVGLDGVTRLSEALEQLLDAVEEGRVGDQPTAVAAARQGIAAIRHYLDDLVAGQPNQTLRLLPAYNALAAALGQNPPAPPDLFFPDLSLRPPRREREPAALGAAEFDARAKAARLGFQRGLLKWLKREDMRGIAEMRDAVASIEATQTQPATRAFWWVTLALLDAIAADAVKLDSAARRLYPRIDLQIKKLVQGSRTVAERLMRDALYYVAIASPAGNQVACVKAAYRLADLIPNPAAEGDIEPLRPILRACREQLALVMDDWNRFCAGTAAGLPQFHDRLRQLVSRIDELKHVDLSRLAKLILSAADELRKAPLSHNDTLGLEVATALLLMDNALDGFQRLDDEFAQQVATVGNRLDAALRGEPLTAMEMPQLDEMSRQAQEKLLLNQVAKEILANLGVIEQALDAYFRDPGKAGELAILAKPLKQVQGALTVLGQDRAVAVLRECEGLIASFGEEGREPLEGEFEEVAGKLSALGFFVEQLQFGPADIDSILNPTPTAAPVEAAPEPSAEAELEQAKRLTQALVGALREQPEDITLRGEIKQSLEMVRDNAQLVDDTALAEQARAAIVAIDSAQPRVDIEEAVAHLAPVEAPVAPSAETVRLAEASNEEIDAELLGIFIEEAHEVLDTIDSQLPRLTSHPHDRDSLTTVRRSFHTLKGSGRMVGLAELGEAAWEVEQVLNRWLQLEQEATPPLLEMLEGAHWLFSEWVAQMVTGGGIHRDASALVELCAPLKAEAGVPPPIVITPIEAPAEPSPTTPLTPIAEFTGEPGAGVTPEPTSEVPAELMAEAPAAELPVVELPVVELPVVELPVVEPPAVEPPPAEPPAAEPPAAEPPAVEAPTIVEAPVVEPTAVAPPAAPVLHLVPPTPPDILIGDVLLSRTLYELYINEAQGHIVTLSHELGRTEPPRPALIRAAHTLAGISATAGLTAVNHLAHALEMALGRLDKAGVGPTESQHLLLARTVGALEGMVGAVGNRRLPQTETALANELEALAPELPAEAIAPAEPPVPVETPVPAEAAAPSMAASPFAPPEAPESPTPGAPPGGDLPPADTGETDRRQLRLTDELDPQLLPIFLEESVDLMRDIGNGLRTWRDQPTDKQTAEQLKRLLHTLKGGARMAGAMSIGQIVHGMETRIEQAVAANAVTPSVLDNLDASFDRASILTERLQTGEQPPAVEAPALPVTAAIVDTGVAPSAAKPAQVATTEVHVEPHEAEARAMLRVRADIVDKLVNEAGEIAIARGRIEGEMRSLKGALLDLTENVIRLRNQLREIEIQAESQMQSTQALAAEQNVQFDPLEFDRFTRFQELTRMMAESVNDVATAQHTLLQNLDHADAALTAQARLNREHSQALMNVRMVPFNTLADRLYRIVRQTAKELGKRADLDIIGGQTELDRSVLEKMTGPLEHLLRNAIVHGLETPQQRLAAGKTEIGDISIRIAQEGNEIAIEFADDGAGLDLERIHAKAIAAGLVAADETVNPEQLTQLIFLPGFSTAEHLTAVAGRGVGMDVVKSETASLGGRIRVDSVAGQGSRFHIYLPLTLAVTQAVLVRSGSRQYAIPSSMIAQVRELKPEAIASIRAEGATDWLSLSYPWRYLPSLLGQANAQPEPARRHWLLLLRAGEQRVALEVDGLLGNQEVVVKNTGPQLARVVGIAGATVLGDGEIVLILNPVALAGRATPIAPMATTTAATPAGPASGVAAVSHAATVMIVDDSLTVRKITSRLLAREGYHVLMAKDGVDALEQLLDVKPDVMLVDIEMPRMDGFDLARNVRADERLRKVPIIMITSRIADKHRKYAQEIGVNNYLGKPYDEDELLGLIAGYVKQAS